MSVLEKYYAALGCLKVNKLTLLPKGSAINNDTVALEAGRKRGSIKKSRHPVLIAEIEQAEKARNRTQAVKSKYDQLKEDYDKALEKSKFTVVREF